MAKKNTIGIILGSVFITLILVGAGGYFALPILYPILNEDLTGEGILLQTKYNESQTGAVINHNDLVYEKIPEPQLNITTSGNSKLSVAFEGAFTLSLSNTFQGIAEYNITLDISGVGNRTTYIYYTMQTAYGSIIETSSNLHISFETEILPAGTYSIALFWKSCITATAGFSNLFAFSSYLRSIYVQEIAG